MSMIAVLITEKKMSFGKQIIIILYSYSWSTLNYLYNYNYNHTINLYKPVINVFSTSYN